MIKDKNNYYKVNRGDKVGIFVPSSPVKDSFRKKGIRRLEEIGFVPIECENILSSNDFVAKEAENVLDDIGYFLENEEIKILWAARGGYGSNYLLPHLKHKLKNIDIAGEKIIIGSSDVSYLLWSLLSVPKITILYGPMVYSSIAEGKFNEKQLSDLLFNSYKDMKIEGDVLIDGKCEGILTGGCMSNLISLIGTPFLPELKNRVLLLEDVNERPYRLDRMFWQLINCEVLSSIKGLVLGEFPGCFIDKNEKELFFKRIREFLIPYNIPVIFDLPVGHSEKIVTIPLGKNVVINTSSFNCVQF